MQYIKKSSFYLSFLASLFLCSNLYSNETNIPTLKSSEITQARAIADIAKKIRRADRNKESIFNYVKSKDLNRALNYLKNTDIFDSYVTDLTKLKNINSMRSWNQFNTCLKYQDEQVISKFSSNIKTECLYKFLELSIKSPVYNNIYSGYMIKNLDFYIGVANKQFAEYIKENSKNERQSLIISNIVANYLVIVNKPLPKNILEHIKITPFLTREVQRVGLDTPETRKAFKQEFVHMLADVTDSEVNRDKILRNSFLFYEKNKNLISADYVRSRLVILSKRLIRMGDFENAAEVTKRIFESTSEETYSEDVFLYLWPDIIQDKYGEASKKIVKEDILNNIEKLSAQAKFWVAYTLQEQKKNKAAKYFYEQIIQKDPINYYAIMAMKQLKTINKASGTESTILNPLYRWEKIPLAELDTNALLSLKRVVAFSRIGDISLFTFEQRQIQSIPADKILRNTTLFPQYSEAKVRESLSMLIAEVLREDKNYIKSFSVIYNEMRKDEAIPSTELLKMLFPQPFLPTIKDLIKNNIDPLIVLSLIRQESAFNPMARSHVGARGLMQLMPSTARSLNRRISSRRLNDPKTNLKLGIKYFKKLYRKYDGNLVYTLSAYNAGESRVHAWKKTYFKHNDNFLHRVEAIPFEETNLYVKLIVRNLFFYKLLDGHKDDPSNPTKIFDVALVSR